MDQQNTQPPVQTQQPTQVPKPQVVPKQSGNDYFGRLFSGRINRRNFLFCVLIIVLFHAFLLLLDFLISFVLGFFFPSLTITNLSITPGQPLPHNGPGDIINGILTIIFTLLVIIWLPFFMINYFALLIRRLHDLNKSGWFCLLSFVPFLNFLFHIYILFFPGTAGQNKYGTVPLPRTNIKQDMLRFS
jgi:uncharacterized membrane protein YhaH (DUF805 family)